MLASPCTDIDLAAELEAELEGALLEIGEIVAAAEDEAGQAAAGEAAAGAAAEAAPGPAAPPGQPIAMQLGQAPGGPGLPVELAAGGGASGGQLQQAQQQAQGADP